ncbi:desulfoferrodoxin family protein [Elusimicrobiota bacterium]
MSKYVCAVCGYIVLTQEVPDNCPVCYSPKDKFSLDENAIKLPVDSDNHTELEKKHIPQVSVKKSCSIIEGCNDIIVKIGEITHPMQPEHSITSVDFYIDDQYVSRVMLTPEKLNPAVVLHLKEVSGKLGAVSHCNMHGSWISELEL